MERLLTPTHHKPGLKKVLGLWDVIPFGVSATLGSGVFVSAGYIARDYTGPSVVICFGAVILAVLLSALCFSEFASKLNTSGVGYSYTHHVYGELVAFCVGVITFVSYCFGSAAGARGFAQYLDTFIFGLTGMPFPDWAIARPLNEYISVSVVAPMVCAIGTLVSIGGMKESAFVSHFLVILNLSLMIGFAIYGMYLYGEIDNLDPFMKPSKEGMISGILEGSGLAFFCLIGWELTCSLREEMKAPSRDLPTGIIWILGIVGFLYCSVSLTLCAMMPFEIIDVEAPFASAFLFHRDTTMYLVVSFVASSICASNVLSGAIGPPRILYEMAKDGLVHEWLSKVSKKTSVPVRASIVCGLVNIIGAAFFDFQSLAKITSCFTLLIYTAVCGGVLSLRRPCRQGGYNRRLHACLLLFITTSLWFQYSLIDGADNLLISGITNLMAFILVCISYHSQSSLREPLLARPSVRGVFECPLVPVVPLLAVWINTCMIASMGIWTLASSIAVVFASGLYFKSSNS